MKTKLDIASLVRSNVRELKPYSSARDEFQGNSGNMVFLDANENPYDNGVNRYPDPQQKTVKSLLSQIKNVPQSNILLGNGSDEVLDLIYRAFCEPNEDNIIILPPTYGMYSVLANINAISLKSVPLDSDFEPNVKAILEAADERSKIVFICSPNNPTANSFSSVKIEQLLECFQGLVVIDEAYIDFSNEKSWLSRLSDFPNLIVTQTLSKAYGMAGIRLGICYASEYIISVLNKIKPPYNVNELTQQRAIAQLENQSLIQHQVDMILKERSNLVTALNSINFVEKIYNSDANFVLAKVDNATKRYDQLIEKGIVVRNRTTQQGCENCLRFTVGTPPENKALLQALKDLNELSFRT